MEWFRNSGRIADVATRTPDHTTGSRDRQRHARPSRRVQRLPGITAVSAGQAQIRPLPGPDARSRPTHRKQRDLAAIWRSGRWRDPDSNRGHHDFQSCGPALEIRRICREFSPPQRRLARPDFPGLCARFPDVTAHGAVRGPFRRAGSSSKSIGSSTGNDDSQPLASLATAFCRKHPRLQLVAGRSLVVPSGREWRTGGDARIVERSSERVRAHRLGRCSDSSIATAARIGGARSLPPRSGSAADAHRTDSALPLIARCGTRPEARPRRSLAEHAAAAGVGKR